MQALEQEEDKDAGTGARKVHRDSPINLTEQSDKALGAARPPPKLFAQK